MFQFAQIVRHRLLDVFDSVLVSRLVVDQDFADVVGQVVAQSPDDRIAFAIEQEGRRVLKYDIENRGPDGLQILQVPGQFFGSTVDAGRAQYDAHAVGNDHRVQRIACDIPVRACDTP